MNKKLFTALTLVFAMSTGLFAQNGTRSFLQPDDSLAKQSSRQIKAGDVTMTIYPTKGAKIMSLKYKDQEVISQLRFPESFGSTFWTSPQKEWYWPPVQEFDKGVYQVEDATTHHPSSITLVSEVSPRLKYRIRKAFSVDKKDHAIVVTYSIINESDETRQVAPWEITRVANDGGVIFFDAPLDSITPSGLLPFTSAHGAVWYQPDEAGQNRKINADGKGWYAYYNHGLLLLKVFDDLPSPSGGSQEGGPAPGEAEIQIYMNRGKSFIELESQGAYTTLKPHEALNWTVRWYLLPVKGDATSPTPNTHHPSPSQLIKTVRNILR